MGRPLVVRGVRLFSNESIPDQSTCIYVDSSLSSMNSKFNSSGVDDNSFSSVNSEFDSSILNFSELNSSISDTYSFVLEDTEERTESLKFYYTNADCLLNKMGELEILLDIVRPDIVVVSEVFPKNMKPSNIDQNEYKRNGFSSFIGNVSDNSRGVVIYVRDGLNADYCSILTNSDFKESVWCEVRINKMEKLLIGGIYKSPNSDVAIIWP